jgi:hypothetical protein
MFAKYSVPAQCYFSQYAWENTNEITGLEVTFPKFPIMTIGSHNFPSFFRFETLLFRTLGARASWDRSEDTTRRLWHPG